MGIVKSMMMRDEDRGWSDPEKYVCRACVDDDYLRMVVRMNLTANRCDYCDGRRKAAPVEAILEPIARALFTEFNDYENAGCPYGRDVPDIPMSLTVDALQCLPLECNENLLADIADAFVNDQWVEAPGGSWMGSREHEELGWSWRRFVEVIKHETRFHFGSVNDDSTRGHGEIKVSEVLPTIGHMVGRQGMVVVVKEGTTLYRVRPRTADAVWALTADQLGAPPPSKAPAGRMNPAGIAYLYTSLDEATAVAETVARPPATLAISSWQATRKLLVIDFTKLPEIPSVFDVENRRKREALLFLRDFIDDIAQPIQKDGSEHIDYVPSQVVSEFFAQSFTLPGDGRRIDGLKYPSAVRPGGENLVLFPAKGHVRERFDKVKFGTASERTFADQFALMEFIKPRNR